MSNYLRDLKNIVHQRLIYADRDGYSISGLCTVLGPFFTTNEVQIKSVLDELIRDGKIGVIIGSNGAHDVYKLITYTTKGD